jgi:beta-lactamase regulating signal transducer with metallopeptidase domain
MQGFMITLLICSVTMSILALLYMAVTPVVSRRYSAKGRYYAWLIIVVGLIIPFRPQFSNAIVQIDVPTWNTLSHISAGSGADFIIPDLSDSVILPPSIDLPAYNPALPPMAASVSWWQIGFAVWLVGLITFLVFHAVRHYRFAKLIKRWGENVTDWRLALLQSLQEDMGISKRIKLYQSVSMDSPLLFGFVNPCILLPRAELDADELRFILKHELVHFKRKDLYYKCLVLLATAVHWFNPLVYLTARAINAQCELSCDDEVVRGTDAETRQQYSETIIGVIKYHTKLKPALSTNFYGGKKGMKNRISSIMDTSKKRVGGVVMSLALAATLSTSLIFATSAYAATNNSGTESVSITDRDTINHWLDMLGRMSGGIVTPNVDADEVLVEPIALDSERGQEILAGLDGEWVELNGRRQFVVSDDFSLQLALRNNGYLFWNSRLINLFAIPEIYAMIQSGSTWSDISLALGAMFPPVVHERLPGLFIMNDDGELVPFDGNIGNRPIQSVTIPLNNVGASLSLQGVNP